VINTIHLITTSALVGIIWIIQLVHYPGFKFIAQDSTQDFHLLHTSRITPIVAPLMCAELVFTCLDIYKKPNAVSGLHLALVLIIWLSTFIMQVPLHQKLKLEFEQESIDKLIKTNWIRTSAWTLKLMSMIYFFRSLPYA